MNTRIMQQQADKTKQQEFDTKGYNLYVDGSQSWRYGIGNNLVSPNGMSGTAFGVTSLNQLNTCWPSETQVTGTSGHIARMQDSVCRQEHGSVASTIVPPTMGEYLMQETQRDQAGRSNNACTSYSYLEPHLRDGTPADGRQKLIYPELQGVPQYRDTSPFVMSEEPVYVNAKQYHAILRRRQLRAKAELENKVTRARKPYLHESRHLHALRRARGCGGRFINTKKPDNSSRNATNEEGNSHILRAPESGYAPSDSSGCFKPSMSHNEFMRRLTSQEAKGTEFLQWNLHRSFLSE